MGRYGFDLDGTLDSCPELAHLARALALAGHKIWIITGSSFSHKAIEAKLYGLNVVDYQKVIKVEGVSDIAIGKAKGEECNKHKIDVYFDNDPEVLKGFASVCKSARVYILNGDILQPRIAPVPKRSLCRCQIEIGEFKPQRCMHCTEFFETIAQQRGHAN
jgi:hypothetical protein